jgi:hypothetical protein
VVSSISILFVVVSTVGMTLNTMVYFQHQVPTTRCETKRPFSAFAEKRKDRESFRKISCKKLWWV